MLLFKRTYAGDYDYGSAIATEHVTSWVDGRVTISGQSQQDAFTDKEPAGGATPTPTRCILQRVRRLQGN